MPTKNLMIYGLLTTAFVAQAQDMSTPKRFDYGKMWTFENPPKAWFKEAYNFTPADSWFDDVRKASLRFATWCSASFVSPNGLIMTNHHCSRDVVTDLQKENEDFDKDGFYAPTLADERKAEGLFVEQLIKAEDITDKILPQLKNAKDDNERKLLQDSALARLSREYQNLDEWKGLRLQTVVFYSGGKFSIYGYKKYSDIRLVLLPEYSLGAFGGDPDNFTYPRYSLDFTFWRAYDEQGNPLNTSDHYFKYNIEGATEDEPVFVIGNPGSTERYRTIKQLEYDRDYRYPVQLEMMNNRHNLMLKELATNPNQDLRNHIANLSNGIKAVTGILNGLKTPEWLERKRRAENEVRSKTKIKGEDPWLELEKAFEGLKKYSGSSILLGPSPIKGHAVSLFHALAKYEKALSIPDNTATLNNIREEIRSHAKELDTPKEREYLSVFLAEIKKFEHPQFAYVDKILEGKSPEKAAERMIKKSDFTDSAKLEKILLKDAEKFRKWDDPIADASRIIAAKYGEAVQAFQSTVARRRALEAKVANAVYNLRGPDLAPDATFTLRIADGVVKGYEYNGTIAPYKTTFYGLYDRYYSHDKKYPWDLPARWTNPPAELLAAPFCFVSTNDIIGGNSGSPIINKNKEVVGLIFDGNMESLPGNFIFDNTYNRSISVHAGGIYAAIKYIYRADRIAQELLGK